MGSGISKARSAVSGASMKSESKKRNNRVPVAVAEKAAIHMQRIVRGFVVRRRIALLLEHEEQQTQTPTKKGQRIAGSRKISSKIGGFQDLSKAVDPLAQYSRYSDQWIIIYPQAGFVVKTKAVDTNRKIFFNVMHHEAVPTMAQAPARVIDRIVDTDDVRAVASPTKSMRTPLSSSEEAGDTGNSSVLVPFIVDVVLPSKEFIPHFQYNAEDDRFDAVRSTVKADLAVQVIRFWNSQADNYEISAEFTLPKIRRGYFGKLQALIMDTTSKYVKYLPAPATAADLHPGTTQRAAAMSRGNEFQLEEPPSFKGWCLFPTFRVGTLPIEENEVAQKVMKLEMSSSMVGNGQSVRMLMRSTKQNFDLTMRKQREKELSYFLPKPYQQKLPLYGPAYANALASGSIPVATTSGNGKLSTLPTAVPKSTPNDPENGNIASPAVRPVPPPMSSKPSTAFSPMGGRKLSDNFAGDAGTISSPARSRRAPASPLPDVIMECSEDDVSSHHHSVARSTENAVGDDAVSEVRLAEAAKMKSKDEVSFGRNIMKAVHVPGIFGSKTNTSSAVSAGNSPLSPPRQANAGARSGKAGPAGASTSIRNKNLSKKAFSSKRVDSAPVASVKQAALIKEAEVEAEEEIGFNDDEFVQTPWDDGIAEYGESAPAELEMTLPVFVVLQNGLIFIYNRDPSGVTYPVAPIVMKNPDFSPKVLQAQYDQISKQPLRLLARLMLKDNAVSSTAITLPASLDSGERTVFLLHFHSSSSVGQGSMTDALVSSYTFFSKALLSMNFTIICNEYSALQTWKMRLRDHIAFADKVCTRVSSYITSTVVNKKFIGDAPSESQKIVKFKDQVWREVMLKVKKGQLELFERPQTQLYSVAKVGTPSNGTSSSDDIPFRKISLSNKKVSARVVRTVRAGTQKPSNLVWHEDLSALDRLGLTTPRGYSSISRSTGGGMSPRGRPSSQQSQLTQSNDAPSIVESSSLALLSICIPQKARLEPAICSDIMMVHIGGRDPDAQEESCTLSYSVEAPAASPREQQRSAGLANSPSSQSLRNRGRSLNPTDAASSVTASEASPTPQGFVDGANSPLAATSTSVKNSASVPAQEVKRKKKQQKVEDTKPLPPELIQIIEENREYALARSSLYLLPLLESTYDTIVNGTATKITTVEMTVSPSADIDSDDDDDDEVDEALRKFTLQSVLYMARPAAHFKSPEIKSKFNIDSDEEDDDELSPTAAVSYGNSSKTPMNLLSDVALLQRIHNNAATNEILATIQPDNIQRRLYKAILANDMLYLFHSGRSLLSLNISCSVSRIAFYMARSNMSAQVQQEVEERRRKQNRESLFYIDSDDSDSDSSTGLQTPRNAVNANLKNGTTVAILSDKKFTNTLPKSEAPVNFPVKRWVVKLVCYNGRSYELGFQNNEVYQDWRRALHHGGINLIDEHPNHFINETPLDMDSGEKERDKSSALQEMRNPLLMIDADATKKYYRVLRKDEKIICTGIVYKIEKVGSAGTATHKQKRILVLTDTPRLIFLDTIGNIVRGHLEFNKEARIDIKMLTIVEFEVNINGAVNKFASSELPEKSAMFWVSRIKAACKLD